MLQAREEKSDFRDCHMSLFNRTRTEPPISLVLFLHFFVVERSKIVDVQ